MRLGCSTILYGGHDLPSALRGISGAGYCAIELCAIPGMAEHLTPDYSSTELSEIRQQVQDAGLVIESIGASGDLLDLERQTQFASLIRAAGALGAPAITTGSGGAADDPTSFRRILDTLRRMGGIAQEVGVTISIKPHVRHAVYDTTTALRMMSEMAGLPIGLNFDASHIVRAGEDPVDSLARLDQHVATARIRDAVRGANGPGEVEQQVPGMGDLDIPSLARAIAALPRPAYAVLEVVGTRNWSATRIDRVVERARVALASYFE